MITKYSKLELYYDRLFIDMILDAPFYTTGPNYGALNVESILKRIYDY